jgi:hypothetical protein
LPGVLGQRRQNRGMEAIAIRDGKIYGFVQSPLRNPVGSTNGQLNARQNVRIVEFDPTTLQTRQFLYIMDNPASTGATDTRADKLGDATATPEGFPVVEAMTIHWPPVTSGSRRRSMPSAWRAPRRFPRPMTSSWRQVIDQMTAAELVTAGINPVAKTLDVDLQPPVMRTCRRSRAWRCWMTVASRDQRHDFRWLRS